MTTQKIINDIVWKACDSFRGSMGSDSYKDYILTMLFVKYISDFHKEKLENFTKQYKGDKNRIKARLDKEEFRLDENASFDYLLSQKEASNLGEIINEALEKIENDNAEKLAGIFRSIDFNDKTKLGESKERNAILRNLLEDFSDKRLDLRPSQLDGNDCLGDAYEYLIANFAESAGKKGGEFYTPSAVSTLLAKLTQPKGGVSVYDPACGSGSLLIKVAKESKGSDFRLYGQEKNGQTHALCRMNMYLHEISDPKILWGDTIRNPLHLSSTNALQKFDIVVANPPFSLDKWGEEIAQSDKFARFKFGIPPKSKGDFAFILHMLNSLNSNGTMAVILPHGVLFRGASEGKIRENIIKANLLHAVIGLPSNLFFGTSIPACILVFKRQKSDTSVLFIDASKDFEKGKNQNKLNTTQIEKILNAYEKRENIDKFAHLATLDEIKQNEYNLNIPRYVDITEDEVIINLSATKQEIANLEHELKLVQDKMSAYLKELGVC